MKKLNFMIGQKVILTGSGGIKEIGTVVPSETGNTYGVWVYSPTKKYASDYAVENVQPHQPQQDRDKYRAALESILLCEDPQSMYDYAKEALT